MLLNNINIYTLYLHTFLKTHFRNIIIGISFVKQSNYIPLNKIVEK